MTENSLLRWIANFGDYPVGKWSLRTKLVGAYRVAGANAYLTIKNQSPMLTFIKLKYASI